MKWLHSLPETQQDDLTLFAMRARHDVTKAKREDQSKLKKKRQELMSQAKTRRELLEKKAAEEKASLSKIHLITSVKELEQLFADIDNTQCSFASKDKQKLAILKEQVRVRKKLLNQKVLIVFTRLKTKRLLSELIKEVKEFIAADMPNENIVDDTPDPFSLVGRHVYHRFINDSNTDTWYEGFILGYDAATRLHGIAYVEEDYNFHYNLVDDLVSGDLNFDD